MIKALNLYAGIGGNRKRWQGVQVTAVELDAEIAAIYKEYFPDDTVIVADAHEYLLQHYTEFDFVWSSRPCITHSRSRMWASKGGGYDPVYPDFGLYEEIIFLQHYFDSGKWVVENVEPYYDPLIQPTTTIGRHLFWTNFRVRLYNHIEKNRDHNAIGQAIYGFDLKGRKLGKRKDQVIRNCINPDIGLHMLECAFPTGNIQVAPQGELFT
jgi:DNA (cytosine-5)-methyltransferase 1